MTAHAWEFPVEKTTLEGALATVRPIEAEPRAVVESVAVKRIGPRVVLLK